MCNLFKQVSRDERQNEAINLWLKNRGIGTFEFVTGFGKTFTAIKCCKKVRTKFPNFRILIVVPTEALKNQWIRELEKHDLIFNSEVQIINSVIKHNWECDFLIIDEVHRVGATDFSKIFTKVKYKILLGLTATLERLDGRHEFIKKYCPVVDSVTMEEAIANKWVSDYVEYKVILDVDDIDIYKQYNREFLTHFEFFNYDFKLANSMVGKNGFVVKQQFAKQLCRNKDDYKEILKSVNYHATALMKCLQSRKKFINNHPEKIRIAQEIIKHRPNSKIITFSATVDIAEKIGIGYVYSGKTTKKKGRATIEEFTNLSTGVLNTVKKCDEGLDVPDLSVAIILGMDSSPTRKTQRVGRVVRLFGEKQVEVFNIIINNTVESEWFNNSTKNKNIISVDKDNLMNILNYKPYDTYKKPIPKLTFRF